MVPELSRGNLRLGVYSWTTAFSVDTVLCAQWILALFFSKETLQYFPFHSGSVLDIFLLSHWLHSAHTGETLIYN